MTARHKRIMWIAIGLSVLALAAMMVMKALDANIAFFFAPSEVATKAPKDKSFRLGGLVTVGSVQRPRASDGSNTLNVRFEVTDTVTTIPVTYTGILPDLFKEGKGVVAQGKLVNGVFQASEVLAKHDENYMPPEAAEALKRAGKPIEGKIFAGQKAVVTQAPDAKALPPSDAGSYPASEPASK
jgi:cytochrome c-type biogenesis protein CcmE